MPSCPHCPRSFPSDHSLSIHIGRAHKSVAAAAGGKRRKARRGGPPAVAGGAASAGPNLARVTTADLVAELARRATRLDKVRDIIVGN